MAEEQAATRDPGGPEERVVPSLMIIQQLGQIGQQISRVEGRLDQMEKRFEERFDHVDTRFDRLEQRVDRLDPKIDDVRKELDAKIFGVIRWSVGTFIAVLGSAGAIVVAVVLHR